MKALLIFATLFAVSAPSLANEPILPCESTAREFAQTILDKQAQQIGWDTSDIGQVLSTDGNYFTFEAYIYKATYIVDISLDDSCFFQSATISEQL